MLIYLTFPDPSRSHPPGNLRSSLAGSFAQVLQDDESGDERFNTIRAAAMKNSTWKTRITSYFTLGIQDGSVAAPYQEAVKELVNHSVQLVSPSRVIEILDICEGYKKKLRLGACKQIYDAMQSWVESVNEDSECDRDVALEISKAICQTVQGIDPRKMNKGLQSIKHAHAAAVSAARRATAITGLESALNGEGTKSLPLLETRVQPALVACKGCSLPEGFAARLAMFRSLVIMAIVEGVSSANARPQDFSQWVEVATIVINAIGEFEPVQQNHPSDEWKAVKPFAVDCMDCKDAYEQLRLDIDAGSSDEGPVLTVLTRKDVVAKHLERILRPSSAPAASSTDSEPNLFPGSMVSLANSMATFIGGKQDFISEAAIKAVHAARVTLMQARERLRKVSGGLDDKKSWKEEAPADATLEELNNNEQLEVLKKAFVTAITKRIGTVKEDCWY